MITIKKTKDGNWLLTINKNKQVIKFNEWTEFFQQVIKADIEQNNKDLKEIEKILEKKK